MKTLAGLLVATAVIFGAGCARTDWIDRTLVTVDVTGTWSGSPIGGGGTSLGSRDFFLELKQEGSRVTGSLRIPLGVAASGPIDGTVTGDVFRFRNSRGTAQGEMTVSGDDMNGQVLLVGNPVTMSLRRADPSSPPASPPR